MFNIFLSNQANPREVLANCIQALQQKQEQHKQKKLLKVEDVLQNAAKSYV